jgi:hypothetical protein
VQYAALELLASKSGSLLEPEVVWGLVRDPQVDLELRRRAMRCLAYTHSYDLDELRRHATALPDPLAYYAARCLIEAKDPAGIELLLELARSRDPAVNDAARQLLAALTGLSETASPDDFAAAMVLERAMAVALPQPRQD